MNTLTKLCMLVLVQLLLTQSPNAQAQANQLLEQIVAVVNNGVITASELDKELGQIIAQLRQRGQELPSDAILRKQVLERLVIQELQLQEAQRVGIRISDTQVNQAMQQIASNNKLTLEAFRKRLQTEGYDYNGFRENLRNDLSIRQIRKRLVEDRIKISEQDVTEYLAATNQEINNTAEHKLRHILISIPEGAEAEVINKANTRAVQILKQLREGSDFTELAIRVSEAEDALEGGDLGWRNYAQIPSRFADLLQDMQVGDISEPVRSPVGFHLLLLEARRGQPQHIVQQTHARHILIKTNLLRDDKTAQATLESIRQRIRNGDDFAELAKAYSEDYGNASKGGDLGWFSKGQMVKDFETAIADLKDKELSTVFQSPYGWHLVQLLGRRKQDDTENYLRSKARQQLLERKLELELELWLRRLRDEAFVELRLPK